MGKETLSHTSFTDNLIATI